MRLKSSIFRFGMLGIVLTLLLSSVSVTQAQSEPNKPAAWELVEALTPTDSVTLGTGTASGDVKLASVFLKSASPSLAAWMAENGVSDMNSPEARAYLATLNAEINAMIDRARAKVPSLQLTHRFDIILGGASVIAPIESLDVLQRLPGVVGVLNDQLEQIDTYRTPRFIGATTAWNQGGGQAEAGEGVIFGVLDSGVWPENPAFSDPDPLGRAFDAPPPAPGNPGGARTCDFGGPVPGDADFDCNNKLIGSYRFMSTYELFAGLEPYEFTSGRDDDGHGTHTASTTAGNAGVTAAAFGNTFGTISGIAPRAHVVNYKVCGELGCYGTDSAAAVQQSIRDGVHVINFSISGGANPYGDVVALAFLDAYNSGILVSASAGNTGPGANTVNHRAPWVATVAASTSDRSFLSTITVQGAGGTLEIEGVSSGNGVSTPAQVAVNTGDVLCQSPAAPGSFTGQIVVCERGVNARTAKSANVAAGGAVGMILYNPGPSSLDADFHSIPSVHIQNIEGAELLDFLAANPGATATFTQGELGRFQGDVIAGFSSRGGPDQTLGVSKPDVTAPGVNILAGYTELEYGNPVPGFAFLSGTSMSSPHNAGAAVLLKWLHPDWTPGQIKSALMTTAKSAGVYKEDGVTPFTPFDAGSGRINLAKAWDAGLTFDATGADYLALSGELWKANYPSLYVPDMPGLVTVSRTAQEVSGYDGFYKSRVTYQAGQPRDFKVTAPKEFFIPANGSYSFDITVDARDVPVGEVRHAVVTFTEINGCQVRFPITIVRGEPNITMTQECDPATVALRGTTDCAISVTNSTFDAAEVSLTDNLPNRLRLVAGSVTGGATESGNGISFTGTVAGAEPPNIAVANIPNSSPAGYLPLSSFGIAPISGVGDETANNFNVPAFNYGGETYTRIGMVSNGYAVVGGTNGAADIQFINTNLPDDLRPNNVLAPFWTDLNPAFGGEMRAGTLTDGTNTWLILDWQAVENYSDGEANSFQIWIPLATNPTSSPDISFTYSAVSDGDGGFLTVGAENRFGNRGQALYFDGVGTAPTSTTEVDVSSLPGAPGETKVFGFTAQGRSVGTWTNYAELTSDSFFGTYIVPFSGEVLRP
ncbi:MAG: S8 family serine peptidase [Oscillochloris sp.]|nr:S8 family serine peptidase [Oscillochloris sp.]